MSIEHKHAWVPLGFCPHPLELGKLGYAFECSTCGECEQGLTQSTWVPEAAFPWMRQPELTEAERARAIEGEWARCKVGKN